jgi:hypothetical protein
MALVEKGVGRAAFAKAVQQAVGGVDHAIELTQAPFTVPEMVGDEVRVFVGELAERVVGEALSVGAGFESEHRYASPEEGEMRFYLQERRRLTRISGAEGRQGYRGVKVRRSWKAVVQAGKRCKQIVVRADARH